MELGNFLGKLKGENKEEPQKFLALILTDEVVQAAVWHVVNEKTEIIATGTPVEWDGDTGTTNELITSVDATISSAVEGLENEPNSVLLGIPHSWTDKDGILGVKREFISKIRKELDLQAVGYVVITDSILSYLKMQEGTPTTSILIQVSRDELILGLVRLGRIEAIETIGRSDDIVDDVTEGVARFKVSDNLPSRIILFNSMHNLDEIIQNLLSVDWQAQFNFLHTPKIESLAKDVAIKALVVGGGSEVAKSLGFTLADNPLPEEKTEDPAESMESNIVPVTAGVGEGESEDDLLTASDFGFTSTVEEVMPQKTEKLKFVESEDEPIFEEEAEKPEPVMPSVPDRKFAMPSIKLPSVKMPSFKLNLSGVKSHWWMIGGGLVALGLLIFYLIWFLPKAVINVSVTPKPLEKSVDITLSTKDAAIDFASKIVPASVETVSETGEKTIDTTGTKTIGDPAKGAVTIYNRTSASKTFTKGTTLASGSLKFTLDSDVTVASKSAGSDYVDVPGKSSVDITASAIGTESNLTAGTELTIASFGKDSYVAKNDAALSGGTSQEVQVVSKDDQAALSKALTDEILLALETKAKGSSTVGTAVYLVPDSAKVEDAKYSLKVGETGKSVTGNLTIKATLLRYKTDDVATLVNSEIDTAVPSGYVRAGLPSTVDLTASDVSEDESEVKGNAKVSVALLPVIDGPMIKSLIKGKSASLIESRLMSAIPGYKSAVVQFTPRWYPTRLKTIPANSSNITISVSPAL
jgi:hypothetical protein